jgi:hypothetical protein
MAKPNRPCANTTTGKVEQTLTTRKGAWTLSYTKDGEKRNQLNQVKKSNILHKNIKALS